MAATANTPIRLQHLGDILSRRNLQDRKYSTNPAIHTASNKQAGVAL